MHADKKDSEFSVREFVAERPDPAVEYFGKYGENDTERGLCVVIPFYNEEKIALIETLKDINTNIKLVNIKIILKEPTFRERSQKCHFFRYFYVPMLVLRHYLTENKPKSC